MEHGIAVTKVACGAYHTLALSSQGEVYAWGSSHHGQLGLGNFQSSGEPRLVPITQEGGSGDADGDEGDRIVVDIAAGDQHSLAVTRKFDVISEHGGCGFRALVSFFIPYYERCGPTNRS